MSVVGIERVGYTEAARRHFVDAQLLLSGERQANAGQLLGLAAECGVKALLVACGAPVDAEGTIGRPVGVTGKGFMVHMPKLNQALIAFGSILPEGRLMTSYWARLQEDLNAFSDWDVSHRYWRDAAWPAASLPGWQTAAAKVMQAIDQAEQDGVL